MQLSSKGSRDPISQGRRRREGKQRTLRPEQANRPFWRSATRRRGCNSLEPIKKPGLGWNPEKKTSPEGKKRELIGEAVFFFQPREPPLFFRLPRLSTPSRETGFDCKANFEDSLLRKRHASPPESPQKTALRGLSGGARASLSG